LVPTKLALALALVLGLALPASAVDDQVHIDYRQKVMSGVGADMGAISDILKHGLPYTAAIALHADRLGDAAALIPTAFREKVTAGPTDAKPEIWQKPDEFKEAIAAFEDAADDLEDAADDDDPAAVQAAFKQLGKACGGCHEPFRKPKEESYKRR
jgi:cytochrome c556